MVHAATAECFSSVFASFDRDADGRISAAKLRLCMKATLGEDVSAEDAEALVASADADGYRLLDEQEFLRLVARPETEEEEGRCRGLREAFAMYEVKGEGCITSSSLMRMLARLGSEQGIEECRAMIRMFDLNEDKVVCFDEFKVMMDV
ncbi:putative calcium-binding protein CML19 [Hordeum vulgare]|uniref:EF-hand domain-containing protein n=1 Tax=Hordeum vulgare subsp. vulgare TaxID=112509 RepID=A0A8I6XG50_HORVV|nr:putative calcium-binding protein CML19 [Hordeum vulgare subsp. vulgare]KAE8788168.1 putative calcium-binding protein CML19 [Hordeum vulgare]